MSQIRVANGSLIEVLREVDLHVAQGHKLLVHRLVIMDRELNSF